MISRSGCICDALRHSPRSTKWSRWYLRIGGAQFKICLLRQCSVFAFQMDSGVDVRIGGDEAQSVVGPVVAFDRTVGSHNVGVICIKPL